MIIITCLLALKVFCKIVEFNIKKGYKVYIMNNVGNEKKNIIAQTIGKKIYDLRTSKKYSREFLAEKVNLSANYIYEIENRELYVRMYSYY